MTSHVGVDRAGAGTGVRGERARTRGDLARARQLLETHSQVHALMAREAPLPDVLAELVRGVESQSDGMLASILLLDAATQTLSHLAAPSLPPAYCAAIDGTAIGPEAGSCGTAAHSAREVFAVDIERDPRWVAYRELAGEHGLGACWSVPVVDATGAVLGTFALYYGAPRAPAACELRLIRQASMLASVAIERDRSDVRLRQLATHDALTGLPNRDLLVQRLGRALARGGRAGRVAVVFLDLNRFKLVNDSMGHEIGDWLLRQVAQRLTASVRPGDIVARFGDDEFVVVAVGVGADGARAVAERLHDALHQPFAHPDGGEHAVTVSLGVALAGEGDSVREVLRRADSALCAAKRNGLGTRLYSHELRRRATDQLRLEAALRHAIERDELRLAYQPVLELGSGRLVGFEALMRWRHPQLGDVAPSRFIPVAEETGAIVAMGDWALATAAERTQAWNVDRPASQRPMRVAVNVSGRQLADPLLADRVRRIVAASGAEARHLIIEVTETALIEHNAQAAESLHALAALGMSVALDDFGTGYSSFSRVRRMPISIIKIDREFVAGLGIDQDATAIVTAMVGLARGLGVFVTAEGVETDDQLALLREIGATHGQGYLWARPLAADGVPEWVAAHERAADRRSLVDPG